MTPASTFTWLDRNDEHQERVREALAAFDSPDIVDPLGLGVAWAVTKQLRRFVHWGGQATSPIRHFEGTRREYAASIDALSDIATTTDSRRIPS